MWKIIPLKLATMQLTKAARIAKCGVAANIGEVSEIPCIAWLLKEQETGRMILVDAGPSKNPERDSRYHNPVTRTLGQQIGECLKNQGVRMEDIREIILTHLHWDHAYGVKEFPWADVYVQRKELQYSIAPFTVHQACYELNDKENPPFYFSFYHQFKILHGDMEFAPGVRLITLPGHSPGSQGVLVDTEKGKCLIAGDLFNSMENFYEDIPTGVNTSLYDCARSFAKVRELGDVMILPGHDDRVFEILVKDVR